MLEVYRSHAGASRARVAGTSPAVMLNQATGSPNRRNRAPRNIPGACPRTVMWLAPAPEVFVRRVNVRHLGRGLRRRGPAWSERRKPWPNWHFCLALDILIARLSWGSARGPRDDSRAAAAALQRRFVPSRACPLFSRCRALSCCRHLAEELCRLLIRIGLEEPRANLRPSAPWQRNQSRRSQSRRSLNLPRRSPLGKRRSLSP